MIERGLRTLSVFLLLLAVLGAVHAYAWMIVLEPDTKQVALALMYAPLNWLTAGFFSVAATTTAWFAWRRSRRLPGAFLLFAVTSICLEFAEMSQRFPMPARRLLLWGAALATILAVLFGGYRYVVRRSTFEASVL